MQRLNTASLLPWLALVMALALWGGVIYFVSVISAEEADRSSRLADVEEQSIQQSSALRIHALARDTKDARANLERSANREIEEMLDAIGAAGKDAGISITIGQSLSISAAKEGSALRAVVFIVEAQGTFAQVMHATALLDSLSVPSSLNELQFEQLAEAKGTGKSRVNLWRLVGRIQFLTTAELPS